MITDQLKRIEDRLAEIVEILDPTSTNPTPAQIIAAAGDLQELRLDLQDIRLVIDKTK